MIIAAKATVI